MAESKHAPKTEREKKVAAHARAKVLREKAKEAAKEASESTKIGKQISGFMDFVREQGIVGLAIGLAIGTQAGLTVKAFVEGFINPFVGFVVGSQEALVNAKWNVIGVDTATVDYWLTLGKRTLIISWGAILSSIITLLAVAAVIFFVVKGLKLDKIDKKKDAPKKDAPKK